MSSAFGPVPGIYTVAPQENQGKTLVLDLDCFVSAVRTTRNVLKTRNALQNGNGNLFQQAFQLNAPTNGAPASLNIVAPAGNVASVISSDLPVHLILTTSAGSLDLGQNTLFVVTSPILSVNLVNDANAALVNINALIL